MKKSLLSFMLAAAGLSASVQVMAEGYDFYVDGIYYNVTSKENLTVEVTNSLGGEGGVNVAIRQSDYSGDVTFPATVTYNDTTYAVKSIGSGAFVSSNKVTSVTIPASIDTLKESSIRTTLAYNENGECVRYYNCPPKVVIEYGETPLYGENVAISTDELHINRELNWIDSDEWGDRIVFDSKSVVFGDSVSVINPFILCYNRSLTEVKFPNRSFSFGAYPTSGYDYGVFEGCTALEKVDLSNLVPSFGTYWNDNVENGYGYYDTSSRYQTSYFIPPYAFRACSALKEVILPDSITYASRVNITSWNYVVGDGAFIGCSSLAEINLPVFDCTVNKSRYQLSFGNRAFAGTALTALELPGSIGRIGTKAFADCASLVSVTFPTSWEWRRASETYYNDRYKTDLYLGLNVFDNCTALKTVDLGEVMTYLPDDIFTGCAIEEISIPASVTNLATTGMMSRNMKSITLDSANTVYKLVDNILVEPDEDYEKTWHLVIGNPYTGKVALENDTVNILGKQLYEGLPIESFDFPAVLTYKYRALAGTNIKSVHIKDSTTFVGYWNGEAVAETHPVAYGEQVFADCKLLETVTIDPDVTTLPGGLFKNCELLSTTPAIPAEVRAIPSELFYGTSISEITIGEKITRVFEDALPASMSHVTLFPSIPPKVTESDSIEWIVNTTIVVPSSCVDNYASHKFWGRAKEIVGNADFEGYGYSGYIEPMPNGLYFAKRDGNICYFDGQDVIDTHIPAGFHAFQLASWHGAIYGVDAGYNYYYQNDVNNDMGDGELYVVNKRTTGFSKSGIVNNIGYAAFSDPFHIYIDNSEDKIYYTGRGLYVNLGGIRVFAAAESYATPYQTSAEIPQFVWNNALPYYGRGIDYGAIHSGFQKDSEGVYWNAYNYSGYCIVRYKSSDIYKGAAYNNNMPYPSIAYGIRTSAMFLDEKNDYVYIFSVANQSYGVYRMPISTIRNGGDTSFPSAWELIDDSPADSENTTADEQVHVRQFTTDGNYIYWCYNADPASGLQSGIKRVNATGTPVVEYVVKDVEGYGICYYEYDGTLGIESITDNATTETITVVGNIVTALQDTEVAVYSINGSLIKSAALSAGSSLTLNYTPGIYIIKAGAETRKIVIK